MQGNCLAYDIYSSWSGGDQNRPHLLFAEKEIQNEQRTTVTEVEMWHRFPQLLCPHGCPAQGRQQHKGTALDLSHHGLAPAASAPPPASAWDLALLDQHRCVRRSVGLCSTGSGKLLLPGHSVVQSPWIAAMPRTCDCDPTATCAHSAAWDLVLTTCDGHGVCSAS